MPKLSQDTISELRRSLPLLQRLVELFNDCYNNATIPPDDEIWQLRYAYSRISELTSVTDIQRWVGGNIYRREQAHWWDYLIESLPLSARNRREQTRLILGHAQRLHLYVKGILESEEREETLNHLAKENASLKEQLTELRRRESTYLSVIKEAQTSTTYSPSPNDRKILLDSYRHQRTILTKNLTRYQETKAKLGLNVPVDILNAIDQTQQDLKQIDANIAALEETSKT